MSEEYIRAELKSRMISRLTAQKGVVRISSDCPSEESRRLADEYGSAFGEAGWVVRRSSGLGFAQVPGTGIAMGVADPEKFTASQLAAHEALKES